MIRRFEGNEIGIGHGWHQKSTTSPIISIWWVHSGLRAAGVTDVADGLKTSQVSRNSGQALRRSSSALLATIHARPSARSQTQQTPAMGRPWRGFCARYAEGVAPFRATTVSLSRLA